MWDDLKSHAARIADRHILTLFEANPNRATEFSTDALGMVFDYSKTQVDEQIRGALLALVERAG